MNSITEPYSESSYHWQQDTVSDVRVGIVAATHLYYEDIIAPS